MPWVLDAKDRSILYHLDRDSRQAISRLSKSVKLNREVVRYRIGRMIKDGIIEKFVAFYALPEVGYLPVSFFMRFQNTSAKDEEEMIEYLKEQGDVIWLASMDGRFNLGFALCMKRVIDVAEFIAEFRGKYRMFIGDFQMANILSIWKFPRDYLVDACEDRIGVSDGAIREVDIDAVDRKILAALGEDGRMKAVDIAKKAGVSADAVADRIKKLKKKGVITNFSIIINNLALNRRYFRTFITFHNIKKEKERFIKYCSAHPNAIQVKRMLGPWEYEVDLELKDETELREIQSKFKSEFSEAVRSTSFASIYKIHKHNWGAFLLK